MKDINKASNVSKKRVLYLIIPIVKPKKAPKASNQKTQCGKKYLDVKYPRRTPKRTKKDIPKTIFEL